MPEEHHNQPKRVSINLINGAGEGSKAVGFMGESFWAKSEDSSGRERSGLWVQGAGSDEQEWSLVEI